MMFLSFGTETRHDFVSQKGPGTEQQAQGDPGQQGSQYPLLDEGAHARIFSQNNSQVLSVSRERKNGWKTFRKHLLKHSKDKHSYIQTTVLIQFPS